MVDIRAHGRERERDGVRDGGKGKWWGRESASPLSLKLSSGDRPLTDKWVK